MSNVRLDPRIISSAVGDSVPLNDLASVYNNAANFRHLRQQIDVGDEAMRQRQITNEAYKAATRPDGSVDTGILQSYLGQNMGGAQIPAIQKANSELKYKNVEIADKQASTDKTTQEVLYSGLKQVDNTIASLAARPDADEKMVYGEMGRLVSAGAFDAQAKHVGVSPDNYAKNLLSTMPVGNPQQLKAWLIQQGAKVADATKRLEMSLPQYNAQDRGGQINEGTINGMTGVRTAGTNVSKTATPGELLSAETSRRGQDLVLRGTQEANAIAKEANSSQVIETPQGYQVVNKGTANARPVAGPDSQPLLGKDSDVAKNARMADRLTGMIPYAKQLLQSGATHSGAGAAADQIMNYVGVGTKGSDAATALETVSGWMTSNVPRFEGPQSDKDTATYRTMAGLVGDRTKPISTRLQALETVEALMQPYMGARTSPFSGPPGTQPPTTVAPRPLLPGGAAPAAPAGPARPGTGGRPSLDSFFRN